MHILENNQSIGKYKIHSFVKKGLFNESYILQYEEVFYFLKIYDLKSICKRFNSDIIIEEINLCEKITHSNVVSFIEKGVFVKEGSNYPYFIMNYINGILVEKPLLDGRIFTLDMSLCIIKNILKGLSYIHSLGLIHNDITPRNIIYNPKELEKSALIDLGHISKIKNDCVNIETSDLTPFFRAPETYNNKFDVRSDIFSVAAVFYSMLFGKAPWYDNKYENKELNYVLIENIMFERISFSGGICRCPHWLQGILKMCLSFNPDNRIQSAEDFLFALEKETCPSIENAHVKIKSENVEKNRANNSFLLGKKEGNGFADVAGMDDIKAMLQQKVLFLLRNPEKAQKYKLTPPNGMLLYGPPGCGKTFFAEKFAEEASLNYIFIKASDVGSTYIHGSQGKIAQLFSEAESKAPSVICFDEFDAMVPKRSSGEASTLINSEVNEFLSQMNNCSQRGIFVIGTTNQRELIDPAVLRTGRMDIHVEIGAPDKLTRKKMFDLYLKERPCIGVDTEKLAEITENYSSSDISFIINDAALVAAFKDMPIDQFMLEDSINKRPSSLGYASARKKIGF